MLIEIEKLDENGTIISWEDFKDDVFFDSMMPAKVDCFIKNLEVLFLVIQMRLIRKQPNRDRTFQTRVPEDLISDWSHNKEVRDSEVLSDRGYAITFLKYPRTKFHRTRIQLHLEVWNNLLRWNQTSESSFTMQHEQNASSRVGLPF